MIFGISTACFFPNLYTEQIIDEMGKMHIENIEVFFSCLSEYKMPYVKELKKRIDLNGLRTYSVHALSMQFEPQLYSLHKRARQDSLDIFEQVLEAGAYLGATVYVFHGPANVKRAKKTLLNFPYIAEYTDPLAEMAKGYGIKLAWENVHWCWYEKPDFAPKLQQYLNTDNLYFTLDIKQAAQAGYDPTEFVATTQDRLINIHVCDYERNNDLGILPKMPFEGEMAFDTLKKALTLYGYDQSLMLEVYRKNYKDYDSLKMYFNKMKSFFMVNESK